MTTDTDNAENQAKAQMESIKDMMDRLEHAGECEGCPRQNESEGIDAEDYHDTEQAEQAIHEDPLEVLVRSSWHTPPAADYEMAAEFKILLCYGGPAVRLRGDLDNDAEPLRCYMEYQDWGTPWTQYFQADTATLLSYAQQFYFGG